MNMNMNWTKVSEQLPPEPTNSYGDEYLCTVVNDQVVCLRYAKPTLRGKEVIRWEWRGGPSPWQPIAWMPMPEPYKEDEEEKK